MSQIVSVERVISWGQRVEPKQAALIVTLDGSQWQVPLHGHEGSDGIDVKSYQGAKKRGIYLGDGLVAAVAVQHDEV